MKKLLIQLVFSIIVPMLRLAHWLTDAGQRKATWAEIDAFYAKDYDSANDLESFARLAEFVAEQVTDYDTFMLDMNHYLLNASSNWTAILEGFLDRSSHYLSEWSGGTHVAATTRFKSTGFAADDNSNQVQHFWYAVAIAYTWGSWLSKFQAYYHEWNGPGPLKYLPGSGHGKGTVEDLELSLQGVELGELLRAKAIPLNEVGDWLRRALG